MKIGSEILRLRKQQGMTQEKLAESLGVSRQAVAKWEMEETFPELENLIQISNKITVTLDSLIKGKSVCSQSSINKKNDPEPIIEFLCEAKRNTYAAKGMEIEPSRLKSHDLQYKNGKMMYLDTYLGGEKFSGEEALWISEIPIWAMNYTGRVLSESFSGDFLKECLSLVSPETPYRGPVLHSHGDYTYHCKTDGEFSWFSGFEEIYYRNQKVYECMYHGGEIR